MTPEPDRVGSLERKLEQAEEAVTMLSDALFAYAGVITRTLVEAGVADRTALADALEHRAGRKGSADHNPALLAFARAVRMNLPGGRFEVIDGGKSDGVDRIGSSRDDPTAA